jgi:hypothetical protein
MATYVPVKRGVEYIFYVCLVSQADVKLFQVNPTLAAGDVTITKDGGAFANLTTLPTVTPAGGKSVKVTVSATETTSDNMLIVFSDAAGGQWCDVAFPIQTAARQIDDLAYPATSGRSMVVDAAGLVDANTVKLGPSGSGTAQTARDVGGNVDAAITSRMAAYTQPTGFLAATFPTDPADQSLLIAATDAIIADTNDIQARLPASLVGGRMEANVSAINNIATAAVRLGRSTQGIVLGTVGAGSTATSIVTSALDPAASSLDQFKGRIVTFDQGTTTAALRGQSTDITSSSVGGVLTVTALSAAPVSGDTFTVT